MSIATVKGAPGHYRIGEKSLKELNSHLDGLQIKNPFIVTGTRAWEAAQPYLPENFTSWDPEQMTFVSGHCTVRAAEELAGRFEEKGIDAVIGIGGGTALDIAKASAAVKGIKTILIPTIAATCAAWTPLSVFYEEDGSHSHYTEFPAANTLLLVEPEIIANAPATYLKAGIGDTLAKYYEADALIDSLYGGRELPVWLQVSQFSAKLCREIILNDTAAALDAVEAKSVTPELIRVIETIILAGGMVGGYGGEAGRIAGAHSIHNGLTEAPEARYFLHGELVSYGILVQLGIEGKDEELWNLIRKYREWGFPFNLESLNIDPDDSGLLDRIIAKALRPQESIHLMDFKIDKDLVLASIFKIEEITAKTTN